MSEVTYLILGGIALLLLLVTGVALVRKRRALPDKKAEQPRLEDARKDAPTLDAERATLDRPVESTEGMSLRELRAAKGARLSEDYKKSEAARAQKEYRKGAQEAPVPTVDDAPELREERIEIADEDLPKTEAPAPQEVEPAPVEEAPATLEGGLARTKETGFIGRLAKVFQGKERLDDALVESIEEVLFTADIGASTSQYLLERIEDAVAKGEGSVDEVWALLRKECEEILADADKQLVLGEEQPFVILFVGVNGVGKTTTIGKLAAQYQRAGKKVLMIAGDTFRAAAVQQLEEWANRVESGFHRGPDDADPSGVIFEGIERAKSEGYDVVLADTAGRLHTRAPLVDELKKIVRACGKATDGAPHETVLVLDANTGQNAIQQARMFHEAVNVDGLVLSKLDGTAKGGIILGITRELSLPVYYIGIGEGVRDLRPFDAEEFVDALF